jgi:hypothetical protein
MLRSVLASTDCFENLTCPSAPRSRGLRAARCALFGVGLWLCPRGASAFEGQWHLGAGLGVLAPTAAYSKGGAVALHGAYGLSDVFDARLTLTSSRQQSKADDSQHTVLSLATLGLAYKLDVIEWVPYFGVRAGGYYFSSSPLAPYSKRGGAMGGMAGCDYSFSRSAAVGAELSYDVLLPDGGVYGALLRAEYRWGF